MPDEPLVLLLAAVSRADWSQLGGKGANLGELTQAGFPVPPGFCLTTAAYRHHLAAHHLDPLSTDPAVLRQAIAAAEMPPALAQATLAAYRQLGGGPVAVRSSATAEDLPGASFAGQQDTFLNVAGDAALLDAVRRCWASLWNDRAVAYRRRAGLDDADVTLAVVVQRMVPATVAGVVFSADPVTGRRDRTIIEAVRGLGESLVSGQAAPARAVVGRSGQVLEHTPTPDGDDVLPPDLIAQVADLAARVEAHYGRPQDVEWAWADGKLYLLQARPITTLTPGPSPCEGEGRAERGGEGPDATLWTRLWSDEYWSGLASPLFYSIFGPMLSRYLMREPVQLMGFRDVADLPVIRLFRGHVYFNADMLKGVFAYGPPMLRTDNLTGVFPGEVAAAMKAAPFKLTRRVLGEIRLALLEPDGAIVRNYRRLEEYIPSLLRRLGELDTLDLRQATPEEILHYFRQAEALGVEHCRIIRWGLVSHNLSLYNLLRYMLQTWCGDEDRSMLAKLLAGVPGNKTLETNKALWDLAQTARLTPSVAQAIAETDAGELLSNLADSPAGQAFLQRLDVFLRDYGHRAVTRDIASPAWEDDPTLVLGLVKRYLTVGAESNPYELEARQARERAETLRRVLATLSPPKRLAFKVVLNYADHYFLYRENQRFYLDMIFQRWRRAFRAIGRQFVERGLLATLEDIFLLRVDEVARIIEEGWDQAQVRETVAERRAEYAAYARSLPPSFLRGNIGFEDAPPDATGLLQGLGASPGAVTAPARVLRDLSEAPALQRGEILVTVATDPGWTPLFVGAGGLVLETGGMLSHGAIVSREYGIPAVTGVRHATRQIHSGQVITVDGNRGHIRIHDA